MLTKYLSQLLDEYLIPSYLACFELYLFCPSSEHLIFYDQPVDRCLILANLQSKNETGLRDRLDDTG